MCCFVLLNCYWGIVTVPGLHHERAKGVTVTPTIRDRRHPSSPFLFIIAATSLTRALRLHQERVRMVRSNDGVRRQLQTLQPCGLAFPQWCRNFGVLPPRRKDGSKQVLYNSFVPKIDIEIRNDEILKVTTLKLKSYVSFGVGSNPQLFWRGSNLCKKMPHRERLQL